MTTTRNAKESPASRKVRVKTLDDPVEKLLFGVAPDEELKVVPEEVQTTTEPGGARVLAGAPAGRLATVRAFLAAHPEVQDELSEEVRRAWTAAKGDRDRYLEALRDRRAEIGSRAQLEELVEVVPAAEAAFSDAVSTYLVEIEGRSVQPTARG